MLEKLSLRHFARTNLSLKYPPLDRRRNLPAPHSLRLSGKDFPMTCTAIQRRWAMSLMAFSIVGAPPASAQSSVIPEGMAIPLETRQDVSSKTARVGDQVELAVARPVTIGGVTVIDAGTPVVGEVTRVQDNGLLGRSGKLDIQVSTVKAGQLDVPVSGERNAKGKSGALGKLGAVGAGIVFLPLAIFVRGKDVELPAGTAFNVYVDREVAILSETAEPVTATASPSQAAATPSVIRPIDPNQALTP